MATQLSKYVRYTDQRYTTKSVDCSISQFHRILKEARSSTLPSRTEDIQRYVIQNQNDPKMSILILDLIKLGVGTQWAVSKNPIWLHWLNNANVCIRRNALNIALRFAEELADCELFAAQFRVSMDIYASYFPVNDDVNYSLWSKTEFVGVKDLDLYSFQLWNLLSIRIFKKLLMNSAPLLQLISNNDSLLLLFLEASQDLDQSSSILIYKAFLSSCHYDISLLLDLMLGNRSYYRYMINMIRNTNGMVDCEAHIFEFHVSFLSEVKRLKSQLLI